MTQNELKIIQIAYQNQQKRETDYFTNKNRLEDFLNNNIDNIKREREIEFANDLDALWDEEESGNDDLK